ncbi:MAG: hypothetical protein IT200_10270 [Thermoleophilia bacterium]|nr:hypothetical protein [Thermoleophilia bacterium]
MTADLAGDAAPRIAVAGLVHHTAELAVRGALAARARPREVAAALGPGTECVVLATCDRHEVWAAAHDDPAPRLVAALADLGGVPPGVLAVRRGRDAVRHLMRVTAGLDALVVGEHEVQGQVGHAWRQAKHHGATGPVLDRLFQHALATGGRARARTGLGRGRVSLASVAVELGVSAAGDGVASAVVVGVDPVARGVARRLAAATGGRTAVLGPHAAAARLAGAVGAFAPRGPAALDAMDGADLVVACATPDPAAAAVLRARLAGGSPPVCVDLCVPRAVPGAGVLDLDELRPVIARAHGMRAADAAAAERLVSAGVADFGDWLAGRAAAPAIAALPAGVERLRRDALERALLGVTDAESRARLERLSRRMAGAYLHDPVTRLRRSADPAADAEVLLRLLGSGGPGA